MFGIGILVRSGIKEWMQWPQVDSTKAIDVSMPCVAESNTKPVNRWNDSAHQYKEKMTVLCN